MPYGRAEREGDLGFRLDYLTANQFLPHMHSEMEICYVLSGSLKIMLHDTVVPAVQDDYIVIGSNMVHIYSTDGSIEGYHNLKLLHLSVDPAFCEGYCPAFKNIQLKFVKRSASEVPDLHRFFLSLCKAYCEDIRSPSPLAALRLMSDLTALCSVIASMPDIQFVPAAPSRTRCSDERLSEILDYASQNHTRKITLSEIAQRFHLDLYYLSHLILESTGMTYQDFLSRVRLNHAIQIMNSDPELNLLDICYEAGFSDPRYLKRTFQRWQNCTVSEYRSAIRAQKKRLELSLLNRKDSGLHDRRICEEVWTALNHRL